MGGGGEVGDEVEDGEEGMDMRRSERHNNGGYSISMTQAKTPSAATFQVLLHTSLLDRRGDLPYCIMSFSPGMYNTLINAHSTQITNPQFL